MCGIAAIVARAGAADARAAARVMAEAMAHRGPDDQGVWAAEVDGTTVALAARRLAIQDPSPAGHQPMESRASGRAICLNGELYNVADVRADLEAQGHAFLGHSDTEVILAAYERWGEACLGRLRGMFALAIWDAPRRRLFVARDRLGIKPLYLIERAGLFLLASEIRAILGTGLVERRIDTEALRSYLALGAVAEPVTMIEGVVAMPAGHYGVWQDGRFTTTRYWSLCDTFVEPPVALSEMEARHRLRRVLEEAVRLHLVSDVPLGVFLSGGIDSSALVGLVAQVADRPPTTASVVFPQQRYSEAHYMRQVVERFGTDHREVEVDDEGARRHTAAAVAAMDQPTFDGVNTYIVSRLARDAGLTVALSGVGSDELFAGYDTFDAVPKLEALRRRVPKAVGPLVGALVRQGLGDTDRARKLARWVAASEPQTTAYGLRRELFGPGVRISLAGSADWPAAAGAPRQPDSLPRDPVNQVSFLELDVYMRNVLLRDTDVMSMACSLEVRVPFLDHVVVEYIAGLPGALKRGGSGPKPLLVGALADLLPSGVVNRPKMGFTLPLAHWLRGTLRQPVEEALLEPRFGGQVAEHLAPDAVAEVWARFLAGKGDWTRVWSLYVLKVWGERHLPVRAAVDGRGGAA